MPPRYAYWTIFIDGQPTAFRAREREELQPTLVQLQRKNTDVTMRWFARGKLWDSREAEQADFNQQRHAATEPRDRRDRPQGAERRGSDWRPGGTHKDPRDRFKKKNRPERAWSEKDPATQRDRDKPGYAAKKPWEGKPRSFGSGEKKPWQGDRPRGEGKPPAHRSAFDNRKREGGWSGKPRERKPWENKPAVPNDRPWQTKPTGPRAQRKPWIPKPSGDRPSGGPPRSDRPPAHRSAFDNRKREGGWPNKAQGDRPPAHRSGFDDRKREGGPPAQGYGEPRRNARDDRAREGGWRGKPSSDRPWQKPVGEGRGPGTGRSEEKRPWSNKPKGDRPWSGKPPGGGDRKPWQNKPGGGPPRGDRPPQNRGGGWRDRAQGGAPGGERKFNPRAPRTDARPPRRRDDDPDRD
jgi:23S rRNA pseudouridine2605 synthase